MPLRFAQPPGRGWSLWSLAPVCGERLGDRELAILAVRNQRMPQCCFGRGQAQSKLIYATSVQRGFSNTNPTRTSLLLTLSMASFT